MKLKLWLLMSAIAVGVAGSVYAQGPIVPPSGPEASMKTLEQIEPRTPISSVPFIIREPGSYYLTENMTIEDGPQHGIYVDCNDVTIDLMGFTLTGTGHSGGCGVYSTYTRNLTVKNGCVSGWLGNSPAAFGIRATGDGVLIENVIAENNFVGISVSHGAVVTGCSALYNTEAGIYGERGSLIKNCTAINNGFYGFLVSNGSIIQDCTARENASYGFWVRLASQVINCAAQENQVAGILLASESRAISCNVNGGSVTNGIGMRVEDSGCVVEKNQLSGNAVGLDVDGTSHSIMENQVFGNVDNYQIADGNRLNLLISEIPETLDWPCVAKLSGSVICSALNTDGVTVNSDNVTIDLAGHSLIGPGENGGNGIYLNTANKNLRVMNGTIAKWKGTTLPPANYPYAIYARGTNVVIESVAARENDKGFYVMGDSTIRDCMIMDNRFNAIFAAYDNVIQDCHIKNCGYGIEVSMTNRVEGCTVSGASIGAGINAINDGNVIVNNKIWENKYGLEINGKNNYVAENNIRGCLYNYRVLDAENQINILLCEVPQYIDFKANIKLAGSLNCHSSLANGITVAADNVTIDLNGHTLSGPGNNNSKHGIFQDDIYTNLRVTNGKLEGWSNPDFSQGFPVGGITARGQCAMIDHVQAISNYWGITTGPGGVVESCTANENGATGIYVDAGGAIVDSTAYDNVSHGLYSGSGTTIRGCSSRNNNDRGIYVGDGCSVIDCTSNRNAGDGICVVTECLVERCVVADNGTAGTGSGIKAISYGNRIQKNHACSNDIGYEINGLNNYIISNTARYNKTNWSVVAGNVCLVASATKTTTAINGDAGGSALGSLNVYANFTLD